MGLDSGGAGSATVEDTTAGNDPGSDRSSCTFDAGGSLASVDTRRSPSVGCGPCVVAAYWAGHAVRQDSLYHG
jgi:hypothetical protein